MFEKRTEVAIKIVFILLIAFVCFSKLAEIHSIPIDKPYFTGDLDEPFPIAAGITALKGGDPRFYWYGGPCVYPFTVAFEAFKLKTGINPYYKIFEKKGDHPEYPYTHKIFPVKPIYYVKVFAVILYVVGAFLLTLLFSLLLFPVPSWYLSSIEYSKIISHYKTEMLAEILFSFSSAVTTLFFILAILEVNETRYKKYTLLTAIFVSITIAIKISAIYMVLLPLSLCARTLFKSKTGIEKWKVLRNVAAALIIPFIALNPATLLNLRNYLNYLFYMSDLGRYVEHQWVLHVDSFKDLTDNIYLLNSWPNFLLIIFFILTCILVVRRNPIAFFGFTFFYFFSGQLIFNMQLPPSPRSLDFLMFPFLFFILYPIFHFYKFLSHKYKILLMFALLIVSFFNLPLKASYLNYESLFHDQFSSWPTESRDDFRKFVLEKQAKIYFYDVHEFSLPNDIDGAITPFTDLNELPSRLKGNEYVAYIKYSDCPLENYNAIVLLLEKRFHGVRIFGTLDHPTKFLQRNPPVNPTIILMRD